MTDEPTPEQLDAMIRADGSGYTQAPDRFTQPVGLMLVNGKRPLTFDEWAAQRETEEAQAVRDALGR